MTVYFRGLSARETFALTDAMIASGETLDLSTALGRKVVDKHSTGGVGDKTSLAVGPIVAACGVPFGKMSGRGLGHTGGTLDKPGVDPGFRVELSKDEFVPGPRRRHGDRRPGPPTSCRRQAAVRAIAYGHRRPDLADCGVDHVEEATRERRRSCPTSRSVTVPSTVDEARRLADAMLALGTGRARGRVPPHRHESAARLRGRERARGARGPRRCAVSVLPTTELVAAACARLLALSDLGIDEAEGGGARTRWSQAAPPRPPGDAGSKPRRHLDEAAPARRRCSPASVEALVRDGSRGSARSRSGTRLLHLGAGRRTKADVIDHAVGVGLPAEAGRS